MTALYRQATAHFVRRRALAMLVPAACLLAAGLHPVHAAPAAGSHIDTVAGRRIETLTLAPPDAAVCVVFENGVRATIDSWSRVTDALAQEPATSLFAYNRPGIGNSEASATARDGATVVAELRQLLDQKGLKPPYILVGHSLGGLYMQLFARRYPDEVKGLVLVDAVYPGVVKKPQEFPWLTRSAKWLAFSRSVNAEIDLAHQSGEQVRALPAIDHIPIVQLINKPTGKTAVGVDFGAFNQDDQTRALVKAMYPKATRRVLDSDHQMQVHSAGAVLDAIREIMALPAR